MAATTTKKTTTRRTKSVTTAKKTTTTTKKSTTTKRTTTSSKKLVPAASTSKITKSKTVTNVSPDDEVSFVNTRVSKTKYTCRVGRKSGTVHLSMTLRDNDGIVIETDCDVERIINTLLINYNIGIVCICDGVYTYEFDKEPFCRFLLDHQLIKQWVYDYCCVDRFK